MLAPGDTAPDFTLPLDDGTSFHLADHGGKFVVLFFYPQDDTQGCTKENLEFSNLEPEFARSGAVLVGISPDSVEAHRKFREKFSLTVPLAADPERTVIEPFGVWQLKSLYGRQFMGLVRTTFVVAPDGRVAAVLRVTRVKGHARKVLDLLGNLQPITSES
ncbi:MULTISPECIES: peroxiredoxin [unclassified Devosia]|uniref:peroxiredoxin n=1 Tax=unclassified Devosia TaxID=196773 RepID=UPI0015561561|nr:MULTISPECIES: peroxiredoxin [unclassified Devosia]